MNIANQSISEDQVNEILVSINEKGFEPTIHQMKGSFSEVQEQEIFERMLKRPFLQWQDQVEIESHLHNLRISQHGRNSGGRPANNQKTGWSQVDTARELKISVGKFSEDLMLANALASEPHLRKVKDRTTAIRLVKQAAHRAISEAEALLPNSNMNQVLLGDSLDILKSFGDRTFDICLTDPPWTEYSDESLRADASTQPVFKEIYRTLKSDAFLIAFLSTADFYTYSKVLPNFGFKVQDYPLIWYKKGSMTHGRAPWQFARDFEPILVAVRGAPSLTQGTEISSIFDFPIVHHSKAIHPNEKPIELIEKILRSCTYTGSKVLDPFGGSGVVAHAAKKLDRNYITIERNVKFFKNIEKRLNG